MVPAKVSAEPIPEPLPVAEGPPWYGCSNVITAASTALLDLLERA